MLIGRTIFAVIFIFQHVEITLIAADGDVMILNSLQHCAPWFVGVCTIVEFAIFGKFEDFLEIACQFFSLDVKGSKAFDARCVNQVTTLCQFYHLTESGGVHACAVRVADFGRTLIGVWDDGVDER